MAPAGKTLQGEFAAQFERGAFRDIIAASVDSALEVSVDDGLCYVIGALCFLGRVEDGLVLYQKSKTSISKQSKSLAVCRFVLGVGLVRVSRYDEGLVFLREGVMAGRSAPKASEERFFGFQGLAFYRFFQCRFQGALLFSRLAWNAAFGANYQFGQTLAADLRGHALLKSGQVALGMRSLEDAARLANILGFGAMQDMIASSMAWYRSCFGLDGAASIDDLRNVVKKTDSQDNFSLAANQVELARQLSLRGHLNESEKNLAAAAKVILVASHRRHKCELLHQLAWNSYLKGKFADTLKFLDDADREVDARFDRVNALAIAGLRLKTKGRLLDASIDSDRSELGSLLERVRSLTAQTGSGIGRNILWRDEGLGEPTAPGDDLLGDLCHLVRKRDLDGPATYSRISKVIETGLLGFLNELMPVVPNGRTLVLDLVPGELFIFDRGNVIRSNERISGLIKTLVLQLASGPKSKRDLVGLIWGYSYHALRHDPMLYALVNRLRKALGDHSDYLIADAGGYHFIDGVGLQVYEHQEATGLRKGPIRSKRPLDAQDDPAVGKTANEDADDSAALGEESSHLGLNHRQLLILSELRKQPFINASNCVEMFKVSRITATRDLSELTEASYLRRIGKGRATQYQLK